MSMRGKVPTIGRVISSLMLLKKSCSPQGNDGWAVFCTRRIPIVYTQSINCANAVFILEFLSIYMDILFEVIIGYKWSKALCDFLIMFDG